MAKTPIKDYVYLASGWFNEQQRFDVNVMKDLLERSNIDYYDPESMCLCPPDASADLSNFVLNENVRAIKGCDYVYANIRNRDLGTLFEVGLAYALGKSVVYLDFYSMATDISKLLTADWQAELTKRSAFDIVVVDTAGKDPVSVACAGYAYGLGRRVMYFAKGLPAGAQFNLMLAATGIAVCTEGVDLDNCLKQALTDYGWARPYTGLIE